VATASELRGQEVETESELAFDLDRKDYDEREQYWGQGEMHRRCIYPRRGNSSENILILGDYIYGELYLRTMTESKCLLMPGAAGFYQDWGK
jgi:hypothetical protein